MLGPPPYHIHLEYLNAIPDGIVANVDFPHDQSEEQTLVVELTGWVAQLERSTVGTPASIVVSAGDTALLEAPIDLHRPDVAKHYLQEYNEDLRTQRCGFSMLLPAHIGAGGGPYTLSVKCPTTEGEDPETFSFAELRFESLANRSWVIATRVRPLIINSVGRSGSSLLCRMLTAHAAIHVPTRVNQFGEVGICDYVCRLLSVMSSRGSFAALNNFERQLDFHLVGPPNFASRVLFRPGHEEFHHKHFSEVLTQQAHQLGARVIREYIDFVTKSEPQVRYVVEKSWNSYNLNLLGLFFRGWKEVFVVRNPAEFLRSQRSFLRKEGVSERLIAKRDFDVPAALGRLAQGWSQRRTSAFLVRYEDLVSTPESTLEGLCKYLGLDPSREFVDAAAAMVADEDAHTAMLKTVRHDATDEQYADYRKGLAPDKDESLRFYARTFGY